MVEFKKKSEILNTRWQISDISVGTSGYNVESFGHIHEMMVQLMAPSLGNILVIL
jgi:hypothetical protein